MRIGYVHSRAFPTVDANVVQVVEMCRAFVSLGHYVTLFIPRRDGLKSDAEAIAQARTLYGGELGFQIVFVPQRKILGRFEVLGSVRGTLKAIKEHPQDLIYSRNPWSVAFLSGTGIPFVWEAHEERVHLSSPLLSKFLQRSIVRTSKKPQMVKLVAISNALSDVWESFGVPKEKLLTAHDAVDFDLFGRPIAQEVARTQLGIALDKHAVVYTGSLKSDRGIEMILESARRIPETEFYIVGGFEEELSYWRRQVEALNLKNAHFPGRVAHLEIPLWLAAADVLLMMWTWRVPTIRVCSPMKLFEYMAARRVIVGPAFPTVLEVLAGNRDAVLFTPDDLNAMERALRDGLSACNDPAMPARALEKVKREHTWQVRSQKILDSINWNMIGVVPVLFPAQQSLARPKPDHLPNPISGS